MSDLIRFLLRQVINGFLLAIIFVTCLLAFDIGGMGGLIERSGMAVTVIALLVFLNGVTFASAQIAFAVLMKAPKHEDATPPPDPPQR